MIRIINLPNKETRLSSEKIQYNSHMNNNNPFLLTTNTSIFDPNNISGSPPNVFMNSLKKRMDVYYEKIGSKPNSL